MILSRAMRWARHGYINAYKILVRKFEGHRPLVKPWYRWEDNYEMGLKEMRWDG
jgi:hypothetical protein